MAQKIASLIDWHRGCIEVGTTSSGGPERISALGNIKYKIYVTY